MKTVFTTLLLVCSMAEARIQPYVGAKKLDNPDFAEMYTSSGHEVPAEQAFMDAIAGKQVYHCILQEASMGKTGRNAGMKNVPKKK